MTKDKENTDKWLNFLDPDNMKDKLIFSSLYIATFESFKDYVVDEVKFLFNTGFSDGEYTFSGRYKTEVLSKDKSIINATLLYLKDLGTIDENDVEIFNELRKYRNKLSHELMDLLFEGLPEELPEKFIQLIKLRVKIEKWWILNVEVPTGFDLYSNNNISEKDIYTSSQMFNQIILNMLSGDEKKANFYVNELKKKLKN
ncbi:MAG: hypothetical protein ACOXZ9_07785 [Bacteroidales bacterium]|jgi:hypothetical protein